MNTSKHNTLISQKLVVIHKKRGSSQVGFAKKARTIEITSDRQGSREIRPSFEIVMKFGKAFEVSFDYLLGYSYKLREKTVLQKILTIQQPPCKQKKCASLMYVYLRDFQAKKTYVI